MAAILRDPVKQPDEDEAHGPSDHAVGEGGPDVGAESTGIRSLGFDSPGDALAEGEGDAKESIPCLIGPPSHTRSRFEGGDDPDRFAWDACDLLADPQPRSDHEVFSVEAFNTDVLGIRWRPPVLDLDDGVPDGGGRCLDTDGFGEFEHRVLLVF